MSLGRAIATVGSFTLLSRIVGFVRDIVLSAVLGSGAVADAFVVAFKLPNFFRRLFAEGAFSAAFVPLFARELQGHGRDAALTFARQAHAGLLLVLLPFSALLILAMPWVVALLAPGLASDAATFDLAVLFSRIAFPYLVFISLVSLYGGVLNGIDRFAEVAFTPVLLNIALIGTVLGLSPFLPNSGYAASIGVVIAGLLQWLWLLFSCSRDGVGMKLVRPRYTDRVRRLVRLAPPGPIGGGPAAISVPPDRGWASALPPRPVSAAFSCRPLPHVPPCGRGGFGPDDTTRTAGALAAYALGLPAFVLVKALTPGFFAREDTRTPLYIAIIAIAANVAMNAAFVYGTSLDQIGIALASSISGWMNAVMLGAVMLHRRQCLPDPRP